MSEEKRSLASLNQKRAEGYRKDPEMESFLEEMNRNLLKTEIRWYRDYPISIPFMFTFGLPRSGTTLISQFVSHTFDVGYFNNIAARFFMAPLHGIRLARSILGQEHQSDFRSDYAKTTRLTDIHEFGYFWRFWLSKHSLEDVENWKATEQQIDWNGLKKVLASIMHEFDKPVVFKNIFGSYHMKKFVEVLDKVVFIYIERDELDVACSILDARKKYYGDKLDKWWSYAPPNVTELTGLGHMEQIAGQIHYLKAFYQSSFAELPSDHVVKVKYEELCKNPNNVVNQIQEKCQAVSGSQLEIRNEPPESFEFREYNDRDEDKAQFEKLLKDLRSGS